MDRIIVRYIGGAIGEPQKGQVFGGTMATNYAIRQAFQDSEIFDLQMKTRTDFKDTKEINDFLNDGTISWCFKRQTPVETKIGTKEIQDIRKGDYVKTHKGRFRKVIDTYKTKYVRRKPILWINTSNSITKCTPEHPFMVLDYMNCKWKQAKDLEKSDKLLYPVDLHEDIYSFNGLKKRTSKNNHTKEIISDISVGKSFARVMGLYLAEGCVSERAIRWTFGNHEKELIKEVRGFCKNIFNRDVTENKRWATTLNLNISSLVPLFKKSFGENANTKRIPREVFKWNTFNKISFLLGYLDGDGHIYDGGDATCTTVSKMLSKDIVKLSNSIGINPIILEREPRLSKSHGLEIQGGVSYQLGFKSSEFRKILDLSKVTDCTNISNVDYAIIDIKKIEEKEMNKSNKYGDFVYNLEVEEDNSYIVNSQAVHNCDDTSFLERLFEGDYPRPDLIGPITRSPVKRYSGGDWKAKYTKEYFYNGRVIRLNESEEKKSTLLPNLKDEFITKIDFIRHGIDLDKMKQKRDVERIFILWAGQKHRPAKNYPMWEEIQKIINDGGGLPEPYEFKTMSQYVVDDYWDTLEGTALLVNTSKYESFCCAVAEGRAKGVGALVKENFNGKFMHLEQPGQTIYTAKDYAYKIFELCSDRKEMDQLQNDSFNYVKFNCGLDAMREDIEEVLLDIMDNKTQ